MDLHKAFYIFIRDLLLGKLVLYGLDENVVWYKHLYLLN